MQIEDALILLDRDWIRNISIINFIKTYPVHSILKEGNSLLIRGISDHSWVMFSSEDKNEFEKLCKYLDKNDKFFFVVEDWMLSYITENKRVLWKLSCMKLYYPPDNSVDLIKNKISPLTPDLADYIFNNSRYKDYTSIEYIVDRINKGPSFGIFEDNKLAAWLMTHDDGAMGFLHVLPEYRSKGYAKDLTNAMINKLRSMNMLPFVQIEESNIQSMNLAQKSGFVKDRVISWLELE